MNSKENSIEQSQMSISWKELGSMSPSHARLLLENLNLWKDRQKSFPYLQRRKPTPSSHAEHNEKLDEW